MVPNCTTAMGAAEFSIGLLITFSLTVYLVRKYGDPKIIWPVQGLVLVSWFLSFSIVVVLPLDISATFYVNCMKGWYCPSHPLEMGCCQYDDTLKFADSCDKENKNFINETMIEMCDDPFSDCDCIPPYSWVNNNLLPAFWSLVYWSAQLFTWLVLPITEAYMGSGQFTVGQRLKSALKENAIVYGSLGVVVVIVVIVYAVEHGINSGSELLSIAMIASNTWGLAALIILLGFGLVDIPKQMKTKASQSKLMRRYQFKAAKLNSELQEAKETHEEVMAEVKRAAGTIKQGSPLRKYINIILLKANMLTAESDYEDYKGSSEKEQYKTQSSLASLHKKVMKSKAVLHRCECQMEELITDALKLQSTLDNKSSIDQKFVDSTGTQTRFAGARWIYEVRVKPVLLWIVLLVCTAMSILLVWSEVFFWSSDPVLSVYALMMDQTGNVTHYFGLELLTLVTVLYLCVCTYTVIFQIRLFDFYYLVPNRQTDSSSMIFAAIAITRLTAPLCLNFTAMAHLDNHVNKIALKQDLYFTRIQGHLDLANNINTFYPIVIVLISTCTLFKVGNRLLSFCGFHQYNEGDEGTDDLCAEGKILISREKRKRARSTGSSVLRRERLVKSSDMDIDELENGKPGREHKPSRNAPLRDMDLMDSDDFGTSDSLVDDMVIPKSTKSPGRNRAKGGGRYGKYSRATMDDDDDEELIPSSRRGGRIKNTNLFDDL